jgi:uncharacterized protein (TIGR02001 family)
MFFHFVNFVPETIPMKKTLYSLSCAALLAGSLSPAIASDWSVSGNAAFTTNYVFRGWSQTTTTNDLMAPAIQGGVDFNHSSGFFAGTWMSNVDDAIYAGSEMELDFYAGWTGKLGEAGPEITLKALSFLYPGTSVSANETNEFSLYLSHDLGGVSVTGGVNYSDDFYGLGDSLYWDAGVEIPAGPVTLALHVGATDFDNDVLGDDYVDYSVGVSRELSNGLGFALTYTGTSDVAGGCGGASCDDLVAFTVSKSF